MSSQGLVVQNVLSYGTSAIQTMIVRIEDSQLVVHFLFPLFIKRVIPLGLFVSCLIWDEKRVSCFHFLSEV